jgi:hypothetical protein
LFTGPGHVYRDYARRDTEVSSLVLNHIVERHPELAPYLDRIPDVLQAPDDVYSRQRTKCHLFYKLGICERELSGAFMVVIVRYNDAGQRQVRTAYATYTPAAGDVLIYPRNHDDTTESN